MTVKDILNTSNVDVIIRDTANLAGGDVKIVNRDYGKNYKMLSALVLDAEVVYLETISNGVLVVNVDLNDKK